MKKQLLSLGLSLAMCLSLLPGGIMAAAADGDYTTIAVEDPPTEIAPVPEKPEGYIEVPELDQIAGSLALEAGTPYWLGHSLTVPGEITVKGNVELLIPEGITLTAEAGIRGTIKEPVKVTDDVAGDRTIAGNTLTIQGDSAGVLQGSKNGLALKDVNLNVPGGTVKGNTTKKDVPAVSVIAGELAVKGGKVTGVSELGPGISIKKSEDATVGGMLIVENGTVTGSSESSNAPGIFAEENLVIADGTVTGTSKSGDGIYVGRTLDMMNGTVIGTSQGDGDGIHASSDLRFFGNVNVTGTSTGGNGIYASTFAGYPDASGKTSTVVGRGSLQNGCGIKIGVYEPNQIRHHMLMAMNGTVSGSGKIAIDVADNMILAQGTVIAEEGPILCGRGFATSSPGGWIKGTVYNGRTGREMDMIGQTGFFTSGDRTLVGGEQNLSTLAGGSTSYTVQPGKELDIMGTLTIDKGMTLVNRGTVSIRMGDSRENGIPQEGRLDLNGTLNCSEGVLRKEMAEKPALEFKVADKKGNWVVGSNQSKNGAAILTDTLTVHPYQTGTIDTMGNFEATGTDAFLPAYRIPTDVRPEAGMVGGSWDKNLPVDVPVTEGGIYTLKLDGETFATVDPDTREVKMRDVLCARGTVIAAAYQNGKQTSVTAKEAKAGETLTGFGTGDTVKLFFVDVNGSPICPMISN